MLATLSRVKKAAVAFAIANAPVVLLVVKAKYGDAIAGEVAAVLGYLGVYHSTNKV